MTKTPKQMDLVAAEPEAAEFYEVETKRLNPQRGFPELWWKAKRPFGGVHYYPAQQRESHGSTVDGWRNRLYWGDNLHVMGHLLREFRGSVQLIYIDPPFDSGADYKKKIDVRRKSVSADRTAFEEKQYTDIWNNDEYLQFMLERLSLLRELLSSNGSIYVHSDWHKSHHLRCVMDEVFGPERFVNEVVWHYSGAGVPRGCWAKRHDNLLLYSKGASWTFNADAVRTQYAAATVERFSHTIRNVRNGIDFGEQSLNPLGKYPEDLLDIPELDVEHARRVISEIPDDVVDVSIEAPSSRVRTGYPTQKPEALLEKLILASSNPGDLVFDCFAGSGTTAAVAMKLGRRVLGADINWGAIQTTTKRLLQVAAQLERGSQEPLLAAPTTTGIPGRCCGFDVFVVNHYDVFRNEIEARELLMEAFGIRPISAGGVWHGELGEGSETRVVRVMPANRIATKSDLAEVTRNLDYKALARRRREAPTKPVLRGTLLCMGHEPDLGASLVSEVHRALNDVGAVVDIEVTDVLRDKAHLQFKLESEARITVKKGTLRIERFYPMNLLQKLSLERTAVGDWRELVDSVLVDFNYDGAVLRPSVTDIPDGENLVKGEYRVPDGASKIRVKITDVLSDVFEATVEVDHG